MHPKEFRKPLKNQNRWGIVDSMHGETSANRINQSKSNREEHGKREPAINRVARQSHSYDTAVKDIFHSSTQRLKGSPPSLAPTRDGRPASSRLDRHILQARADRFLGSAIGANGGSLSSSNQNLRTGELYRRPQVPAPERIGRLFRRRAWRRHGTAARGEL